MRVSVLLGVALALAAGLAASPPVASARSIFSTRPVPHTLLGRGMRLELKGLQPKKNPDPYTLVLANDGEVDNLDLYQYDSYYGVATYLQSFYGLGGGGVASYGPNSFAFASTSYGILYGNVMAGSNYFLNLTAQLVPSHSQSGPPFGVEGLAFDSKGNLYAAGNFLNCIDEWNASSIAGYSGTPLAPNITICPSAYQAVLDLATDGKTVYALGLDNQLDVMLGTVAFPSGKTKITQSNLGNEHSGTGYADGVSVTSSHEVYVSNGFTIYGFLKGKGAANQGESVVQGATLISSINLNYGDQTLFGSEFTVGGARGGVLCMSVPLNSAYTCGTSGYEGFEVYQGIAAISAPKN